MPYHPIHEEELIEPALVAMTQTSNGEISTSDLIAEMEEVFHPTGQDAEVLDGRYDTKFSQKVRNLKSHKTLLKRGYAEHIFRGFRITPAGRRYIGR